MELVIEHREYLTAWAAYLGSCVVLIGIGCLWTRGIRNAYLRGIVRLVASTAMLVPVLHEDSDQVLVPAMVVVFLGAFIGNTVAAVQAANTLGFACLGAMILAIVLVKAGRNYRAGRTAVSPEASEVAE